MATTLGATIRFRALLPPGPMERGKSFGYDELVARDKANLDLTWLKDESLADMDNLPSPDVLAREIVEDHLTAALAEFEAVAAALEGQLGRPADFGSRDD